MHMLDFRFEHWGELEYSVITLDKVTKLSRGTGFVCFKELAKAKQCLQDYENAVEVAQLNAAPEEEKKNSILVPSIPESASELTKNFMIDGRFVNVNESISRDIAQKISLASTLSRRAQDKRHLYLMREGVIFPNSDAASLLTPQELEKRTAQFANRKRLLATNPNLFISRTRLSIRGLGPKITDTELRNEAKLAVKKFWAEVESKTREGIEQEVIDEELEENLKTPGPDRKVWVKQAKVIREVDRIDPLTKKPKSKGYGFIEFTSHADALACLRFLNNNPNTFGKDVGTDAAALKTAKRPIVEFAVENRLVLKKRVERNGSASKDGVNKRKAEGKAAGVDSQSKKQKKDVKVQKDKKTEVKGDGEGEGAEKDKVAKPKKKVKTFKERREIRKEKQAEKYKKPEEKLAPVTEKLSKKEKVKQNAVKKVSKKKQEDEKFSSLVANYKKTLAPVSILDNAPVLKTSKWYD
jgi:nucleolar protein 4